MQNSDFDSLVPPRDFSRRSFVQTSVGSGFAAAVLPVSAQVITTPTDGLDAGPVTVPVGAFSMPAYRAQPAGRKNLPVVLVVSEIFGVHEHIADVCRRLARQGYLAVAPELFVRQGDAKAYTETAKLIAEVISKVPDAQVLADLDATLAWARAHGGDARRLAVTGFCFGGRITWLYAAHQPAVKAGVAWYGRLAGATNANNPRQPVQLAGELKAPVLGLYGGQDAGIPVATVAQMQEALKVGSPAARQSDFVLYRDSPHAFHADYRPSYRKADAEDGWARMLAWFKANGVAA
jgi:carboxymethylenebutenolidase